jgi:hypothetical protein
MPAITPVALPHKNATKSCGIATGKIVVVQFDLSKAPQMARLDRHGADWRAY